MIGVHLYCYDEGPYCTAKEDRVSAVRVAKHLGIPLLVWDLRKEYKDKVISYFFDEYKAGRTPNPDVMCNREIKFGLFMERALRKLKVDYVATGHYARVAPAGRSDRQVARGGGNKKNQIGGSPNFKPQATGYKLLAGRDTSKDQSYFLYTITSKQLEHILFPIGDYRKEKVREMAKEMGLPNHKRHDSMGICFIGPVPIAKFLRENLPAKVGSVVNTKGEIIGEHDGVWFFTEGQRHGFRIFKSTGLPLYVIGKNVTTNTLVVGRGEESNVRDFWVEKPHWIRKLEDNGKKRVGVRIRHLGEIMPATTSTNRKLLVRLAKPVFGVAPGQSAVFYQEDEVLGGGIISLGHTL